MSARLSLSGQSNALVGAVMEALLPASSLAEIGLVPAVLIAELDDLKLDFLVGAHLGARAASRSDSS